MDKKKLTFAKPRLWRDPMDRLLFQYYFQSKKNEGESTEDHYFAQCWTLKHESQSLWNEYAPLHNGVRVKTTIGKLFEVFRNHPLNHSHNTWLMGLVDYLPIEEIKEKLENSTHAISEEEIAHTLLVKLWQYSHEQEVRVIFDSSRIQGISSSDLFGEIPIQPLDLFEKLLLDPRMPENIFEVFKERLLKYGFSEDQIDRSELYDEELLKQKVMSFAMK